MVDHKLDGIELGRVTAENIYSRDGSLLVREGTIISYEMISKLKKHKVNFRDVLSQISLEYKEPALIPAEEMKASLKSVQTVFEDVISDDRISTESSIPENHIKLVKTVINSLMDTLSSSEELLYRVTEVIGVDDYTYRHSVNVTILTILTAKAMGYVESEIKEIALGALLHDIGKALVPGNLIKKKGRLTPEEESIMKTHPQVGYELVKDLDILPRSVKDIIRLHHEKLDGSGYPNQVSGLNIPKYVRLITVCDMYDAMTTTRSYRKRMPLHTALEILMKDAVYKIDADIYRQMTSTICLYPTGMGVVMSDGRVGIVSEYRHQCPTRPLIQIVEFNIKEGQIHVESVDLQESKTLFIVDSWDVKDFSHDFKDSLENQPFYEMDEKEKLKFTSSIS